MIKLDVNTASVYRFSQKLGDMHRSALPVAIRTALNSAAFDVKQNTMPQYASSTFTERKKTFFKSASKVNQAKGFDISKMQATVGFLPTTKNKQAVEDLEKQEHGGTIEHRKLVPMDSARVGNTNTGLIRAKARLSVIKSDKFLKASDVKANSKKQQFIRAAIKAKNLNANNAFVLGNSNKGKMTLSRIDSISFNKKARTIKIKRTPLYTINESGKVSVARTNFMKRAALETSLNLERYFINAAIAQFKKYNK